MNLYGKWEYFYNKKDGSYILHNPETLEYSLCAEGFFKGEKNLNTTQLVKIITDKDDLKALKYTGICINIKTIETLLNFMKDREEILKEKQDDTNNKKE